MLRKRSVVQSILLEMSYQAIPALIQTGTAQVEQRLGAVSIRLTMTDLTHGTWQISQSRQQAFVTDNCHQAETYLEGLLSVEAVPA